MEVPLKAGELLHYLLNPFECLLGVSHFVTVQGLLFNKMGTLRGLKEGPHHHNFFILQISAFSLYFFPPLSWRKKRRTNFFYIASV